jgi:hypothetical protein
LSALEEKFLSASRMRAGEEETEREAQHQRELKTARELAETQRQAAVQLRKRAFYLLGAFILALIMAGVALYQGERVRQATLTTQNNRRVATACELAAASLNNLSADPERSILLALQSISTTRSADGTILPESLEALHRAIVSSPIRMTLTGHGTRVLSAAYSPDGALFATASGDGTAILWDASTGSQLRTLVGHGSGIQSVAFSLDGKMVATGSEDDTAKLWEVETGAEILTLPGNGLGVTGVAFDPSDHGTSIAVASGITRLFLLNIDDLLALARSRVTRSFTPAECRKYLHIEQCPLPLTH